MAVNPRHKKVIERRRTVRKLMLKGYTAREIHSMIGEEFRVRYKTIQQDITEINHKMDIELENERDNLIRNHIARYEELYRYFMDEENDEGKHFNPIKAMQVMEKKEKLLGFLNNNNEVVVNNNKLVINTDDIDELKSMLGYMDNHKIDNE